MFMMMMMMMMMMKLIDMGWSTQNVLSSICNHGVLKQR